jgi:hypothetical protein
MLLEWNDFHVAETVFNPERALTASPRTAACGHVDIAMLLLDGYQLRMIRAETNWLIRLVALPALGKHTTRRMLSTQGLTRIS